MNDKDRVRYMRNFGRPLPSWASPTFTDAPESRRRQSGSHARHKSFGNDSTATSGWRTRESIRRLCKRTSNLAPWYLQIPTRPFGPASLTRKRPVARCSV